MSKLLRTSFRHSRSVIFAGVLIFAGTPGIATAGIKCWTNKDGVRECGNAVPPEYSQMGHEVKNERGMTVKKQGRARSLEEITREREAQELAAREKAVQEDIAKKQAAADKVLLDTFGSEDDLMLARDGQLANVDAQIKVTESQIAKLQRSLDGLITKAAEHERRNQKLPKKLVKDIDNFRAQIVENKKFIESKHLEKVALNKKFDDDLNRFRQLRSAQR